MTFIRWWGAKAFADFYGVKLPTEAQWEYAAKGVTYAVHAAISGQANPYGLYNMGGNVWEWMADNYEPYTTADATDPLIETGSTLRAWRGGSWNYHQATLESSARYADDEDRGNDHFGFRIAN